MRERWWESTALESEATKWKNVFSGQEACLKTECTAAMVPRKYSESAWMREGSQTSFPALSLEPRRTGQLKEVWWGRSKGEWRWRSKQQGRGKVGGWEGRIWVWGVWV
ncbi:hypothetical protein COP1_035280 [Malus domestica]